MTKASDLEVNIDILDDDGLSQLRCRTCGKPVIGNLNGRGCPGCGWYIEQLVIDKDGWPVIVDGTPGRGLTGCRASTDATSKTCRTSSDRALP